MSNYITSLIRTHVPILVGTLISWLATKGLELDESTAAGLIAALTGALISVYYIVVRTLERKFPRVGVLLGVPTTPEYK